MGSTSDKIAGKGNELAGKVKQATGDVTGNDKLRAEGAAQELKGDAQQAKGKVKDTAKGVVDRL
ncbi:CsbD family protein [Neorhizobium lilium]|uniref:CsbD family protein n=1 Tax=Neorhizobium lilium TaxID=2503024 RepID=A0A3S3TXL1_9HYPH|nr:CsbD family protein [Neorhizobium lilium]RWX77228.1 CsbD family protein [Neorhizobium lilium]